jgi:hypothetical protein
MEERPVRAGRWDPDHQRLVLIDAAGQPPVLAEQQGADEPKPPPPVPRGAAGAGGLSREAVELQYALESSIAATDYGAAAGRLEPFVYSVWRIIREIYEAASSQTFRGPAAPRALAAGL